MRKRNRRVPVLALLCAVALAGCSKKQDAPPAPPSAPAAPKPAAKPAQAVQPQLSSARPAGGGLDFQRRTDPFKPFAPVVAQPQPKSEQAAATPARPAGDVLPIQSFETNKFKVSGIIAGLRENQALVIDPNGKGYVIHAGMPMGSSNGVVSRITASTVEVTESYKDEKGRTRKRIIVLTLAKKGK